MTAWLLLVGLLAMIGAVAVVGVCKRMDRKNEKDDFEEWIA